MGWSLKEHVLCLRFLPGPYAYIGQNSAVVRAHLRSPNFSHGQGERCFVARFTNFQQFHSKQMSALASPKSQSRHDLVERYWDVCSASSLILHCNVAELFGLELEVGFCPKYLISDFTQEKCSTFSNKEEFRLLSCEVSYLHACFAGCLSVTLLEAA